MLSLSHLYRMHNSNKVQSISRYFHLFLKDVCPIYPSHLSILGQPRPKRSRPLVRIKG
jgi:hypothetical protein